MEITAEVSPVRELRNGRAIVGLEAVQIGDSRKLYRGLLMTASKENTSIIYLGAREALMANGPLSGYPILPGEKIMLPIDDVAIWAISEDTDQILNWMSV